MGKKHKKDSKKKKHRSRSRSPERTDKHRHHKRHHKEKKKEKHIKTKSDESDSEDDCIILPPPPKISRTESPPPSDEESSPSPPPFANRKDVSPPPAATSDSSLSIAETNKLRAKLGLKPLDVSTPSPVASKNDESSKPASELMGGTDMGEFVHKPADNIAQKVQVEKIKAKLAERKEKRLLEAKLTNIKKLGDESDDDDVSKWVLKSRKNQEEREKAEKKAKELDDMDAVFGIGELVEEDLRNEKRTLYGNRDLKGLRVEHDMNNFSEGREIILTLKDKGVLEDGEDALVNVNMLDDEHYKKNISNRKQNQFGYNALDDDDEMDEDEVGKRILKKYDEEIDGAKKSSFTIGVDESAKKDLVKKKLLLNKRVESLNLPAPTLATEYYTEEELSIKFKKPKKKIRKIRDRKRMLKADDLLSDATNGVQVEKTEEEEWLKDIGTRRRSNRMKSDSDTLEAPPPPIISIKQEPEDIDILMDVDDLPLPPDDIAEIKVEPDDDNLELELALKKARRLKQKEATEIKPSVDKVAEMVLSEEMGYAAPGPGGSIVLNSTAEFCRTLGDIPTYGLSGNRDEDAQEILDFERELKESKKSDDKSINRGGWNDVELDDKPIDITPYEAPILDAEPDLGTGVAGALRLAVSKGYLEKETSKRPSASRFAHLQAQNYSIEDKAHVEEEKFGRRERYMGPTCDFKEKDNYKPNVKLDYIDDDGHVLCAKEAFRYLSHKFHGKGPGKNKVEKRMKKQEQEVLMKQMSSTDTPLGTLSMLQQKQKETQSPFIVLSGSKNVQTPASISKTKL